MNNQLNDLQNHELKDLAARIEKLEKSTLKEKKCDKKSD
jgi:hypothetical protein